PESGEPIRGRSIGVYHSSTDARCSRRLRDRARLAAQARTSRTKRASPGACREHAATVNVAGIAESSTDWIHPYHHSSLPRRAPLPRMALISFEHVARLGSPNVSLGVLGQQPPFRLHLGCCGLDGGDIPCVITVPLFKRGARIAARDALGARAGERDE